MGRSVSLSRASSQDDTSIEQMLLGNSAAMRSVQGTIRQIAQYPDTTVLLQGESGTGKDVAARAIHLLSQRASHQFIPINCAAIPDTLLETELFGVEAGAFTDAKASRDGYVLRADGGTLFLDEIGAMPFALQAKLLRFLETRSFRRIGGTKELHVDLRVISATNLDLKTAVAQKIFREDLFYRLQVIPIRLPALRERREDIPLLVEYYLQKNSTVHSTDGQPLKICADALALLERYDWPGNVRELFAALQYSSVLCDGIEICPQDLPENVRLTRTGAIERLQELQQQLHLPTQGIDLPTFLSSIESTFIREALELTGGNQVQAAALLHMSRDKLRYRLSRM